MGKKRNTAIALLLAAAFCSCEKDIEYIGQYDGEKLVMFSCASAGMPLEVKLSKSAFILSTDSSNPDDAVRDARVSGRCGGKTIEFEADPSNPGRYVSSYEPEAGETVELFAGCPGFADVSGSASVPSAPSFRIDQVKVINDDEYYRRVVVRLTVNDAAGLRNYYRLKISTETHAACEGEEMEYSREVALTSTDPLFANTQDEVEVFAGAIEGEYEVPDYFDDGFFDGKDYTFEVTFYDYSKYDYLLYEWYYDTFGYDAAVPLEEADIELSSSFVVELSNVSDGLFKYARSLEAYHGVAAEVMALFGEPVSVYSNIDGGIGCFGAMNSVFEYFNGTL